MIIDAEAEQELLEAAAWYDGQRGGLGDELLAAIDSLLVHVSEAPDSFPTDRFDARARRAILERFPYAVVFVAHEGEVRVVAFAHSKRRPLYWQGRL